MKLSAICLSSMLAAASGFACNQGIRYTWTGSSCTDEEKALTDARFTGDDPDLVYTENKECVFPASDGEEVLGSDESCIEYTMDFDITQTWGFDSDVSIPDGCTATSVNASCVQPDQNCGYGESITTCEAGVLFYEFNDFASNIKCTCRGAVALMSSRPAVAVLITAAATLVTGMQI